LQNLLDFEDGNGSLEEIFFSTFSVSKNPLLQIFSNKNNFDYCDEFFDDNNIENNKVSNFNKSNCNNSNNNQIDNNNNYNQKDNNNNNNSDVNNKFNNINNNSKKFIDLISNGSNVFVNRSNRKFFVKLFINYALYDCCKQQIDDYLSGLKFFLFDSLLLQQCNHSEVLFII
jgi:hypothetical protein